MHVIWILDIISNSISTGLYIIMWYIRIEWVFHCIMFSFDIAVALGELHVTFIMICCDIH